MQIFDQKKFKKKDQGFLGVINIRVGDVLDLSLGGDGLSYSCVAEHTRSGLTQLRRNAYPRFEEIE